MHCLKLVKKISKVLRFLVAAVAILIPSLIAGFRASSVGTDVQIYGISSFELALHSPNLKEFYSYISLDYGFYFITYLASRLGSDYHIAFFLYEFITMFFAYLFIKECHKKYGISMGIGCLLYLLLLFNTSLNIMRQSIAIAISAYAFTYLWKDKRILYLLFMLLAFTFHSTTIISLLLWPLYIVFRKNKIGKPSQLFWISLISFTIIIVIIGFSYFVENLVELGILDARYLSYIGGGKYAEMGSARPQISTTILQIMLLFIVMFNAKLVDNKYKGGYSFYLVTCLLVCLISIFGNMMASYLVRIIYGFIPFQAIGLAMIIYSSKGKDRLGWMTIILGITFVLWFYTIVVLKNHETYPYIFYWNE